MSQVKVVAKQPSEGKIRGVAGNTTDFYGSAQSLNFLSVPCYYFLTAMLLLPFTFTSHSLLFSSSIFCPLCAYTS